jgi:acetyl esterase/lipase
MLPIKVFRPASNDTTSSPLIVLYFAGGFIMGSPTTLAGFARSLVKCFNVIVVAPTYRLAPEYPFSTSIHDGWDTFSWVAENATSTLRTDPSKGFIIDGVSSGGNISNIVTHLTRDNNMQPPITGVWLSCAAVRIAPKDVDQLPQKYRERNLSRTQDECVNSLVSTPDMVKFAREGLKPDLDSKLFAPMMWPTGHKGFPKTYSQVCGMDTGRDEALTFDDMLKEEGTPTRPDLYAGLPHIVFHSFKNLPQSKKWGTDTMDGFKWLLDN